MAGGGGLVVVGTPIGNLEDLSPRAARCLREADLVACEDTRRTAVLLRHAGAQTRMVPVHRHNEAGRVADLVARMREGARVALVSDAGMPVVSDPGSRLVRAAADAGLPVEVVPGPSAVIAALAVSGLAGGHGFAFLGFVPRKGPERRAALDRLDRLTVPAVLFESPQRLPALLDDLAARWPARPLAVCRELTKLHEETVRGTAAEVAERLAEPPRGEIAVVVGAAAAADGDDPAGSAADERLREAMAILIDAGVGAGRAAEAVAALGVAPRNAAYRAGLEAAERRRAAT
ncbi:16S rRNA (cytidine(1402)-2'-O)-methyltransferase [Miltoncostaea marina]|uniref:16S rRNA (cytidine(1402)-2'-O)-methyltransferase n=1 Tax=Miltoncostaea marina TaxID=2843215 RepID=UPI001C3C3DE7|nr:16S rRNA (cytidine(1402)-2'-O)-methyltransferase [Miltoncostaea marina]